MKNLLRQIAHFLRQDTTRRNLVALGQLFLALVVIVSVYSTIFHVLMDREGQDYSWFTGVYWTLTVMSTLGFGDITFETDLGVTFDFPEGQEAACPLFVARVFRGVKNGPSPAWLQARLTAIGLRPSPPWSTSLTM